MGFSEAVEWWEEWQLRLLVLASLFLQYFLFAAALLRKRRVQHWFRALIWFAYQGCDVVSIYALATLFSRHKKEEEHPAAHLDTLWAPLLLLHLGGQDGISAYSIEDNENWRRHLLLSVSQITVAVYVFRKSWWSDDARLLRAAILLFVPGIFKCLEKPWILRNATVASIMSSSDSRMEATVLDDEAVEAQLKSVASLDGYLAAAAQCVESPRELFNDQVGDEPYHLFVDLAHPYAVRLNNLRHFATPLRRHGGAGADGEAQAQARQAEDDREFYKEVHGVVRASLSKAFDRLYTKHKASFGGLLRAAVVLLTFVDIGLFQRSRGGAGAYETYGRADVVVTYVLLCCTAALEFVSACVVLGSGLPLPDDELAQYNLIAYVARNKKYRRARHLATGLGFRDSLDRYWCTAPPQPSRRVTELVHRHLAAGWTGYIKPSTSSGGGEAAVAAYRRFNDSRGRRTLERRGCAVGPELESSLRAPFDEAVLLWHLATELCHFDHVDTGGDAAHLSRVISNYMAYLLFVKPEMLVPGARRRLFRAVYLWLKKMIGDKPLSEYDDGDHLTTEMKTKKAPPKYKDEVARKIIQEVTTNNNPKRSDDRIRRAWALAHELIEFGKKKASEKEKKMAGKKMSDGEVKELKNRARKQGDDEMWELIQGVWVEMLCFSAGRCRGYLHAKALGKGGEYLSYVWLLMSYMGMETMPERMQRPEVPAMEGDAGALVRSPDELDDDEPEPEPAAGRMSRSRRHHPPEAARSAAATASAPEPAASNRTAQQHPLEARAAAATSSTVVPIVGDDDNV
ncbi:hypothetical protein U9M48_002229 [Paspalum notatum var. saurae]|uniref:DUF4220 domain-containing protein n=1 Tax=Paspalum notatum var. saurae TaxID=547442 RepID=A0AAQ3SDD5_PASNO